MNREGQPPRASEIDPSCASGDSKSKPAILLARTLPSLTPSGRDRNQRPSRGPNRGRNDGERHTSEPAEQGRTELGRGDGGHLRDRTDSGGGTTGAGADPP